MGLEVKKNSERQLREDNFGDYVWSQTTAARWPRQVRCFPVHLDSLVSHEKATFINTRKKNTCFEHEKYLKAEEP